ncbi:hypothetical protein [Lihuaxuella thermophila]|uniref:Predicted transcriptional regulator, contains an HTH and PUA-like domains n=1 Tax=Lihuaxuella thermophila TaxID=1173111 RepID=A0A1H8CID1_9BACL|nr:hypothetical protein [Lihuaxuella thermophila]SEM94712.1 Predicted transcriptional regulator, contains an HTH and PUA-like domains [Lihuaxuella thermophila]
MQNEQLSLGIETKPHSSETFIVLSLKEKYFEQMLDGYKRYEYRRKFINRPVTAFIYLVSPVKSVTGIVKLGKPIIGSAHEIAQICENEEPGTGAYEATLKYLEGLEKGFAIPVLSVEKIDPVSLQELRDRFKFVAPQSYMIIDNKPELLTFLQSRRKNV